MLSLVTVAVAVSMLNCGGVQGMSAGYYGPRFYPEELKKLEEARARLKNEAVFLGQRVVMLEAQKQDLDQAQDAISSTDLPALSAKNTQQYTTIRGIKDTLKAYFHRIGAIESRLASATAISNRLKNRLPGMHEQLDAFTQNSNIMQDGLIGEIAATLTSASTKLNGKLTSNVQERKDDISAYESDVNQFNQQMMTRTCFLSIEEVEIDVTTGEGTEDVTIPAGEFSGNVPTVHCGLQGMVSEHDPNHSKGYRSYGDDRERLSVTVDCKAFEDRITVKAFDKSASANKHGEGRNRVVDAYVEVRACSFGAQAGF